MGGGRKTLIRALTNSADHRAITSSAADSVEEPEQVNPSAPQFATCEMKNNTFFSYPVIPACFVSQIKSTCPNTYLSHSCWKLRSQLTFNQFAWLSVQTQTLSILGQPAALILVHFRRELHAMQGYLNANLQFGSDLIYKERLQGYELTKKINLFLLIIS